MIHKLVTSGLVASAFCLSSLVSIPAMAAPPAKAFGELPVGFHADLSPDGKHLAMILNMDGRYVVATRPTDQPQAEMIATSLGDGIKPIYVKWVNNERYFVSIHKQEDLFGTPVTTGHIYTKAIGEKTGDFLLKPKYFQQWNNQVIDWLDDDPDHVLMQHPEVKLDKGYSSMIKKEYSPFPNVYRVNVKTGRSRQILNNREDIERWITDDNGQVILGFGRLDDGTYEMDIYDRDRKTWTTDKAYPGLEADMPIFGAINDGRELIVGHYNGRDTLGVYIYDLKARKMGRQLFHNDSYDASGVVVSRDGDSVLGVKYVADEMQTELVGESKTLLDELSAKLPGFAVQFIDQTDDGKTMIVRISAPYEPGGLFIYSKGDAQPAVLQATYTGITSADLGNVVPVKYAARDGEKIPAYITMPPTIKSQADFKNLPFIVLPHGGPYGRDAKRFDYFAQFFATRGYGVMQMNFRGSEGYGKRFEEAGRNNWIVMQEDVEDATNYLLSKGYADPDRLCIAGWSYGGYAALMGAAKDNDRTYKCVIAMAALTDIQSAKRDFEDYRGGKYEARTFFGEAMNDAKVRRANTPIHVADQIKVPVFLAHGDIDQNVRFDQFEKMKKELEKAGVDGTYMAFENEDHFLSQQKNREAFFEGVEDFLLKVNGPSEFMAE